ncbi:hypothetical protein [Streptomyces sp. NPDC088785]|uniref:hypothetical protein n=1 Tax=Streptomyces sp. NPDC088785 TaxID=3365897 RepID=UPI0037FCAF69
MTADLLAPAATARATLGHRAARHPAAQVGGRAPGPGAGAAGWNARRPRTRTLHMPQKCAAAPRSDGTAARWADTAAPVLPGTPPRPLAADPGHGHRSTRDEATARVSGAARRSS